MIISKTDGVTSQDVFYIESKEGAYSFNRNTYDNNAVLHDTITKQEYDKIISKASNIMGDAILKKRKNSSYCISPWIVGVHCCCILIVILYAILLLNSQQKDRNESWNILITSVVIVSITIVVISVISFYNYLKEPANTISLCEIIKKDLDLYFKEVNTYFYLNNEGGKYVYKGKLEFSYNMETKKIMVQIEKENKINDSKKQNVKLPKNLNLEIKNVANEHIKHPLVTNESQDSKFFEEQDKIKAPLPPSHIRVKSIVSVKDKQYKLSPMEIEIELNKFKSN